jgi:hypothetical protein
MTTKPESDTTKYCSKCEKEKDIDEFYKDRSSICRDCNNNRRREKYKNDEDFRKKIIIKASEFKHKKVIKKQIENEIEQIKIGIENKKCKYCDQIKKKDRFRHNRLKCKDCERDNPLEKFKRNIRNRIYTFLKNKKTMHYFEYLGCTSDNYSNWIFNYNNIYSLDNYGKEWHIDHVIPLSHFNLENKEEQLIAFNWRNTMPLSIKENLSKNNKIITSQIYDHLIKIKTYHLENKLDLPQVFIDLFAKHLADGEVLKLSLPLTIGNISEELG